MMDAQMLFSQDRAIAHDRRGHGRSTQTADGNGRHYAADPPRLRKLSITMPSCWAFHGGGGSRAVL